MVLWQSSFTFGHYLAEFAYTYVNYYAGLASAIIALVFHYYGAWIFVYGSSSTPRSRACGRRRRSSRHCEFWHRPHHADARADVQVCRTSLATPNVPLNLQLRVGQL